MGDYNLTGLNPRDFEHLIQALALKVIAPGVMPFGDGPDGGREATYTGKMQYPSQTAPWDGYLVLQAKFRARPLGDPTKDGDWALEQLKADLAKFADPDRHLVTPDYYVFVTNVVLTPMQGTGSKDKARALLQQYQAKLGFRGYAIWDFDTLCRLLDGHSDIRARYAAFITAGDVLATMMDLLQGQQPDFAQIMTVFLQNELRADQYVKLEQAGHSAEQKTALAQVFVDLPDADRPIGTTSRRSSIRRSPSSITASFPMAIRNACCWLSTITCF